MGGFILNPPDYSRFPVDAHQIRYLVANGFMKFPVIDSEAIWDKNKADTFVRTLTSVQVLWFTLQCIGRAAQHLSISTFELDMVAFVLCTFPTSYFWRHKPLDVSTTITLFLNDGVQVRDILQLAGEAANEPFKFTPLDFVNPAPDPYEPLDSVVWALQYLFGLAADPKHGHITTFKNTSRMGPKRVSVIDITVLSVITATYVTIHIIGWNFTFPTPTEQILWRVASLVLLGSPFSYGVLFLLVTSQLSIFCRLFRVPQTNTATQLFERMHTILQYLIAAGWVGTYGIARLYIIVEAFVGLRALPAGVFQGVEWSNFFPHV
ncbi:MAG: hypothetical protein Q9213_000200 [Squamulea squamosa]